MRPKLVVNEPMLVKPTAVQIRATDQSVVRSSAAARSSRRVSRYWCGDSANALRNSRLKWAGDRRAAAAMSATVSASAKRASARSFARNRYRVGCTGAMQNQSAERGTVAAPSAGSHGEAAELVEVQGGRALGARHLEVHGGDEAPLGVTGGIEQALRDDPAVGLL